MRIVIDISPAVYHRAGIGRYAHGLTTAVATEAHGHQCGTFYNRPHGITPLLDPDLACMPCRVIVWGNKAWRARVLLAYYLNRAQDPIIGEADLFHATDHLLPNLHTIPSVFSLHDLTFLTTDTHTTLSKLFLKLAMGRFLTRADAVIVPSEATKRDALKFYSPPPDKVHVIPYGVDSRFFHVESGAIEAVRHKYGLPDAFLLTVGTIEPRKNLTRLLGAYLALRAQGVAIPLILVGRRGWRSREFVKKLEDSQLGPSVRILGFVDDVDLPALYAAATVFAYPSLYEGFGFPVLEAMAAGTPVVSSDAASLPEVVGQAGLLVSPYDTNGLAEAIRTVIAHPDLRASLREAGLQQAQRFTWSETARATLEVYEAVTR